MKAVYYTNSDEKVVRDKPDGELLYQDYFKDHFLFGIKIRREKINYLCTILNNNNKTGFK